MSNIKIRVVSLTISFLRPVVRVRYCLWPMPFCYICIMLIGASRVWQS